MHTKLRNEMEKRILVLDGAMGTMIQQYKPTEVIGSKTIPIR